MRNSCQSLIPSPAEDVGKKTSERTDMITIKNNPKINHRLLAEYDRLVATSKGVVRVTQGVDYNLAHPLASKDRPTDAHHTGKRLSEVKNT